MATNLQLDGALSMTPQPVRDETGTGSQLHLTSNGVAVGDGAPTESGLSIRQVAASRRAHLQFGDPSATPGEPSAKLSFAGFGIEHAGFVWIPNGQLTHGRLILTFGGRDDPTPRGPQPARVTFQANGNVGIGTTDPSELLQVNGNLHVAATAVLGGVVAGTGTPGQLVLRDETGERIVALQAGTGDLKIGGHGKDGDITLFPASATDIGSSAQASIHLDGASGDIRLGNADAAEEFEAMTGDPLGPGDVMVLGEDGRVGLCDSPYDRRVAGVVSGAGEHRPGIVLGHDPSRPGRVRLALMGRVYCKVIADDLPISIGDLLTTSPVAGHAMRVSEPGRAFGSVLGKAMGRLESGRGLVEVLVALQ